MQEQDQPIPDRALDQLTRGSKIEAIKIVRVELGLGLKEAKDMVEDYLDTHPEVMSRLRTADASRAKSFYGYVVIILALAVLVYMYVTNHG